MRSSTSTRLTVLSVILAMSVVSCSSKAADTTQTSGGSTTTAPDTTSTSATPQTTTTKPQTTTTAPATTVTNSPEVTTWLIEPALDEMPDDWKLSFLIPYGEEDELLGSAPGGENLTLGPDYGAQSPDGSWIFMDAAKQRLAYFDASGTYMDAVALGPEFLAQGIYFQYQLPHVLADGTLVASRFDGEATDLLVVTEATPSLVSGIPGALFLKADDGVLVYALDSEGELWSIDPGSGSTEQVDYFKTQAGNRYRISLADGVVTIELPDAGVEKSIPVEATIGDGEVHVTIEVATTDDGTVHLFLLGLSESDESVQLAGYATVGADGTVSTMSPMMNPFTPADPGSPAHIGAAYGSSMPWFMIVGEGGVEVYGR